MTQLHDPKVPHAGIERTLHLLRGMMLVEGKRAAFP